MKATIRAFVRVAATCLVSMASIARGADDPLHISAETGKPLKEICDKLVAAFHWRISYEEPPPAQADLVTEVNPSGVPMLVLRRTPVSVNIPVMRDNTFRSRQAVLNAVLAAHRQSGNSVVFRAIDTGDFIHFVPEAMVQDDGKLKPYVPLLDTRVTIPKDRYLLGALVDEIMRQVSQNRAVHIVDIVPINLSAQVSVTEEARDEPARDVLVRVLYEVDSLRLVEGMQMLRLTWSLGYFPGGQHYFFSVVSSPADPELVGPDGKRPDPNHPGPCFGKDRIAPDC